jgi:hypothetical protein
MKSQSNARSIVLLSRQLKQKKRQLASKCKTEDIVRKRLQKTTARAAREVERVEARISIVQQEMQLVARREKDRALLEKNKALVKLENWPKSLMMELITAMGACYGAKEEVQKRSNAKTAYIKLSSGAWRRWILGRLGLGSAGATVQLAGLETNEEMLKKFPWETVAERLHQPEKWNDHGAKRKFAPYFGKKLV